MTNGIAIGIVLALAGFFALDHYVLHIDAAVFLGRKGLDLLGYVAFWR